MAVWMLAQVSSYGELLKEVPRTPPFSASDGLG